jgi:hypothetical protein
MTIYLNLELQLFSDGYFERQATLDRFSQYSLSLNVSLQDYGVLDLEGVTFNWNTRALAVCGGKQVSLNYLTFIFSADINY